MKFLLPALASAWASVGYEEIARYTENALVVFGFRANAHARAKVHGDLVSIATYGRDEVEKYPALEGLQFQEMRPAWQCGVLDKGTTDPVNADVRNPCFDKEGKDHNCILGAAYYFLDHFIHESLLEFPEDPRTQIKSLPLLEKTWPMPEQTVDNKLKWLLSLVADMHQPFRWGSQEFDYGKHIKVELPDKTQTTLFDLFERKIPEAIFQARLSNPSPDIMQNKLYDIKADEDVFMRHHSSIRHSIAHWFWRWADQTGQRMCDVMGDLQLAVQHKIKDDPNAVLVVPQETYDAWEKMMLTQMLLAGYRSAQLLENLHEHRKHKEGAQEGRGLHHPRKHWGEHLTINLIIAAIQLPVMWGLLQFLLSDKNPFFSPKARSI